MTELTAEQEQTVRDYLDRYDNRIDKKKKLIESDSIPRAKLSSFHSTLADTYEDIGILEVYNGEIKRAQSNFESAAEHYLKSAQEYDEAVAALGSLPLAKGIYAANLSGRRSRLKELKHAVAELRSNYQVDPGDDPSDRFYLAATLAEIAANQVCSETIQSLEAINQKKSEPEATYGSGICRFARGIDARKPGLLREGIESMIDYHCEKRNQNHVINLIMAPEATALLITAHSHGYNITLNSNLIPVDLVNASVSNR